ncbi:MAG: hypothetical protein AAF710_08100 [Planctomycetota bacterium]
MCETFDHIMEHASRRLAEMDYLGAEALCEQGVALARANGDWRGYARALLPLQECRRQRRMTAADTAVQLGTNACLAHPPGGPRDGCVAVTEPQTRADAARLDDEARDAGRCVVVLWCEPGEDTWRVATHSGPRVHTDVSPPPSEAQRRRLTPDDGDGDAHAAAVHWFIAASEALGDAALAAVAAPLGSIDRVTQLEAMLAAVGDHEILHQRLADAARALAEQAAA